MDAIPADADLVVCQGTLAGRVEGHEVVTITNFISDPALDALVERLKAAPAPVPEKESEVVPEKEREDALLSRKRILTGLPSESKEEAILRAACSKKRAASRRAMRRPCWSANG